MVSIKTVLFSSAALLAAYMNVEAAVAPTYPSPGAVEKAGQPMEITWTFDGKDPDATYKIDFMTGSNTQQKKLATVATAVKANALKYSWTAPEVNPNAAIYFFMFTG
ncbi:hypothetical protein BDF20DRAFT_842850 [Mycotypha africana]|uniref:uncharacterized protein n=1 Tax=Mycotypha africana TaxID=64632 RepID=UPI0023017D17|nr:uncharacterized protein BDF20DRAFT_842850 [Mycotypha africana]KAI8991132.1 hypothetical protein BDF20DRAFT_842850 [Mycotypha africana]